MLQKQVTDLTSQDFQGALNKPLLDAVVGEPFYSSSLLPWHNLHYWYSLCKLRHLMKTGCTIVPGVVELKAIAGIVNPRRASGYSSVSVCQSVSQSVCLSVCHCSVWLVYLVT